MKKLLSILMCVSLLSFSFYSCSDDDDNGGDGNGNVKLKVRTLYSTDADGIHTSFDTGAKVYVFYGFDFNNANGYTYQIGGKYVKGSDVLNPDQTATIGTDGNAVIEQKFKDRKITVVIDSKHYQGQYREAYFEMFNEDIDISHIFKLQE